MCSSIIMSDIQANAEDIDSNALHSYIMEQVKNGEYDTYLEAFSEYVQEHDLDIDSVSRLVSPSLKSILYKEACDLNMINNPPTSCIPEELFG